MTNGPHREETSELPEDTIAQGGKFKVPQIPKSICYHFHYLLSQGCIVCEAVITLIANK